MINKNNETGKVFYTEIRLNPPKIRVEFNFQWIFLNVSSILGQEFAEIPQNSCKNNFLLNLLSFSRVLERFFFRKSPKSHKFRVEFHFRWIFPSFSAILGCFFHQEFAYLYFRNLPLPHNDPSNIPDPYVKLYLLPDRHKESKRKTQVMKDNCNPVYDEQFEYVISPGDVNTKKLEVSICTQKGWLSTGGNVMGQVYLTLSDFDLTQTVSGWYDLLPVHRD